MRITCLLLTLLGVTTIRAQQLELPRVELPTVELPRVELPRVQLPGMAPDHGIDGGQVQVANGLPIGRWKRTGFGDHIQLFDASGSPGIELHQSAVGDWIPILSPTGGTWRMDVNGTLHRRPY